VPLVHQRGGKVALACQRSLVPLLRNMAGVDQLVAQGDPLPRFDVHAPFLSLPRLFGTTLQTIPAAVPYLHADPDLVLHWRQRLAAYPGFRIGVAWQGSAANRTDRQRSFALAQLAPLAQLPGVRLVSLQKGPRSEQLHQVPFEVVDLGGELDAQAPFQDTAALVQSLDLVVCCDTAVAHLAGALGARAWLALMHAPDWRWLLGRPDSPWYPTLRLFRQPTPGDWPTVFAQMAQALQVGMGHPFGGG